MSSPPGASPPARNASIGVLVALAAALIGSGWQIVSRHGVTTSLGPLELAVLRYGIPTFVLAPLWRRRAAWPAMPPWRWALLVLGGGLPFGLVVLAGARWAPAAHMGIFMAGCMPLFVAAGDRLLGERLGHVRGLGLALMALGVAALALGQGLLAGLLGLVAYAAAIARLGAARAALSAALVPVFTALGAAWLLGEAVDGSVWLALALASGAMVQVAPARGGL